MFYWLRGSEFRGRSALGKPWSNGSSITKDFFILSWSSLVSASFSVSHSSIRKPRIFPFNRKINYYSSMPHIFLHSIQRRSENISFVSFQSEVLLFQETPPLLSQWLCSGQGNEISWLARVNLSMQPNPQLRKDAWGVAAGNQVKMVITEPYLKANRQMLRIADTIASALLLKQAAL